MLTFEYKAIDPATGQEINQELQAENEAAASNLISKQGLTPIDIKQKNAEGNSIFRRDKVKSKDKVLFSRQLSTLINAGLPLTQSLRTVSNQTENKKLTTVINEIITAVEGGKSFADSLEMYPDIFSSVFINLVAAGEASGTLDDALERIANQQEKDAETAAKVKGALVYPIIVLVVILGVIIFMLVTVLPQVEQLYVDLKQELPFITAGMLAVSDFIINFWYIVLIATGGFIYMSKRYVATESGRSVADKLKMSVPIFGRLFMKLYMARFARTGQTLMASGVPMLEMLRITGRAVDNVHVEKTLVKASEKVKGGKALSSALEGDENFLPLVPQMISIGEQSGSIDSMMEKVASFYEKELDNEIKTISTTIEPILMVVLAIVAGTMVGAILIPVYGLVGQNL